MFTFQTPYEKCVEDLKSEKPLQDYVSPQKQQEWCKVVVQCMEKKPTTFRTHLCLMLYPIR